MIDADANLSAAQNWVVHHLPHSAHLLVGDALWVDLVNAGWLPSNVVWFYKLDSDPAVRRRYPGGWRSLDYVIDTDELRSSDSTLPQVRLAIAHSTVVQAFGTGGDLVEVRRIAADR